ncbi:MAG: hypothetical protein C4326_09205 [Ignavibacteria bacterium]
MRTMLFFVVSVFMSLAALAQPGLTGKRICIDPGHGGHNSNDRHVVPDPGIDFWESESNFRKALLLKPLLEEKGAWVILTRTSNDTVGYPNPSDPDEPSLSARWQLANANNVHWFHSIHSNAFNQATNYTLVLLKEDIPTRQPAFPEALVMSNIISPKIQAMLRTTPPARVALDYTFYGGPNGGFNLGVLLGLVMPGQLSEGSFHDVPPETRRLMNDDYRKMEAYALRNAFMEYYNAPADTLGIVAGLQTEVGTGRPINGTRVRLLPENRVYNGDQYNNGFSMFDRVAPGPHTVRFETPNYRPDSASFVLTAGGTVFVDRQLESLAPPSVISTIPAEGDTLFSANRSLVFQFSKVMDTASVRRAFSITPPALGRMLWSNVNTQLTYDPDSLLNFFVHYTVVIDTQARSAGGQRMEGPFALHFRTRDVDIWAPQVVAAYPDDGAVVHSPSTVLNVSFDELLNPNTVTLTNVAVQRIGGSLLSRTLEYFAWGSKSGINVYMASPLEANASYRARVSGITDVAGNAIPNTNPVIWQFSIAPGLVFTTTLDALDTTLAGWLQPLSNSSTVGVDSASFVLASRFVPTVPENYGSGLLRYVWRTNATEWLLREQAVSGQARNVSFRKEGTLLQAYIFGDGSRNRIRFALEDSLGYEVSRWYTLDWVGWRFVQWDLEHDSLGVWNGNGQLDGTLRFDSFQMQYVPSFGARSGQVYIDQLHLAQRGTTGVSEEGSQPKEFALHQNYPNPFNPTTSIRFALPGTAHTTLKVFNLIGQQVAELVNTQLAAGEYRVEFDGRLLPSGVYIYRLESGGQRSIKKMVLIR